MNRERIRSASRMKAIKKHGGIVCTSCGEEKPKTIYNFTFIKRTKTWYSTCISCLEKRRIKVCATCGNVLPNTSEYFYINHNNKTTSPCKRCHRSISKQWKIENSIHYKKTCAKRNNSPVLFKKFAHQLSIVECSKEVENGLLSVKCHTCGKYYKPTAQEVYHRLMSLKGLQLGNSYLFCSTKCNSMHARPCTTETATKIAKAQRDVPRWTDPILLAKISGKNNHAWKGGISVEPYCPIWARSGFKEKIKERDDNICQNPDCWDTATRIAIHHINYNKKDCHPKNLITVCTSCNSRANGNKKQPRKWWQEFYENLMRERFMPDGMTPRQQTNKGENQNENHRKF